MTWTYFARRWTISEYKMQVELATLADGAATLRDWRQVVMIVRANNPEARQKQKSSREGILMQSRGRMCYGRPGGLHVMHRVRCI